MNSDQITAVRKFANGLKECLESKKKDDEIMKICLQYFSDLIDIHLQLAELDFQKEAIDMERSMKIGK